MTNNNVLAAVDPGRRIGFAFKLPTNSTYHTCTIIELSDLESFLKRLRITHLALETFARSGRIDSHMIHTMEIVGAVKMACVTYGIQLHTQQPQERRSYIPDAIALLRSQGRKVVMTKAKDDHEVDALSHLLRLEDALR